MTMTMRGPWISAILVTAAAWLASAPISSAETESHAIEHQLIAQLTGDAELADEVGAIDVVDQLYANAERLLRASGHEVSLEVSDLWTLDARDFARRPWADMVTVGGPRLRLEKTVLTVDQGHSLLHVTADWQDEESGFPWKASPSFSVADAADRLDTVAHSKPLSATRETLTTRALSSYTVTLEAHGITRTYRAAAFWRQQENGELALHLQDNVLTPVETLAFETAEATPHRQFDALFAARPELRPSVLPHKMTCLTTTDTVDGHLRIQSGQLDHWSGEHAVILKARTKKTCNGACTATCEPSFLDQGCYDYGIILSGAEHRASANYKLEFTSGHLSTTCGAAVQCAIQECTHGACSGMSLSISWSGNSFRFSGTANALVAWEIPEVTSAGCLLLPDNPPDPPGPPCSGVTTEVSMLAFADDAPSLKVPADHRLTRSEPSTMKHHGEPVTYVMAEWALVDLTPPSGYAEPAVTVRKTSSATFAHAKLAPLDAALRRATGEKASTVLVVEHPRHEDNSRAIPMPELRLAPIEDLGAPPGRIMVRADFGEDRQLQGFDVLHDPIGLDEHQLEQVRDGLSMGYQNEKNHRAVAFAVLEIAEAVTLEKTLTYLPKCCCSNEICL
ncbi:MAG: hypothetical protein AAGC60_13150 [Acidobacteriota bacterium]